MTSATKQHAVWTNQRGRAETQVSTTTRQVDVAGDDLDR
jgi:hypothetical protein